MFPVVAGRYESVSNTINNARVFRSGDQIYHVDNTSGTAMIGLAAGNRLGGRQVG
jgi:hypothetical protein